MVEASSKNDPTANWPEDVKQAYEHLKVPSLYDTVLTNEKLSLEIRKQDRELKTMVEQIQQLSSKLDSFMKDFGEEWEEVEDGEEFSAQNGFTESPQQALTQLEAALLEENQFYLEQQSFNLLIEAHDEMRELSHTTRQVIHQLLALLPKKEGLIPHPPTWYPLVEEMLQSIVEGIEKTRYQILARLEEMNIEVIDPQLGEAFNESFHHVLDHLSGGESGTIARVIRVGYRQEQTVLRLAEVSLYN